MAKNKITAITKRIESRTCYLHINARNTSQATEESSRVKRKPSITGPSAVNRNVRPKNASTTSTKIPGDGGDKSEFWFLLLAVDLMSFSFYPSAGEDFRSALQQAANCIRDLESYTRSGVPTLGNLSSASSSKATPHSPAAVDLNGQRIETMSRLIDILRRHMRVRYELKFTDVLQA